MNATHSIRPSWNEVTQNCSNRVWKKHAATWKKLKMKWSSNQNLVELANEAGLEGINEGNVEELLQSLGKSLTNDELQELAEQFIQSNFTVRELSTELLSNSINVIM